MCVYERGYGREGKVVEVKRIKEKSASKFANKKVDLQELTCGVGLQEASFK